MKRLLLFAFLCTVLVVLSNSVQAEECQSSSGANSLLQCLLKMHPDVENADLDVKVAEKNIDQAAQRPNPILLWRGQQEADRGMFHEVNALHTFELGGKQSARVDFAKSGRDLQRIGKQATFNEVKTSLILNLYRLRQIFHEIEVIQENRSTFERMISQYKRIGKMNPEQEISVNVFRLASEEVKLTLGRLENERDQILAEFEVITGESFVPGKNQLPKLIHSWPELEREAFEGPVVKMAQAELIKANREYGLEKAKSWPNLSIGPRVVQTQGPQGGTFVGAAVNLPIPILSLNKGGRASALANKSRMQFKSNLIRRKVEAEAQRLLKAYERSSNAYRSARESSDFHSKHSYLHKMISRGVVSPSLVIELHRQIIAFYQSLHSQELSAVQAKWAYYSLTGSLANRNIED